MSATAASGASTPKSNSDYLASMTGAGEDMKAFTLATTAFEMDMKKFENAQRAIQQAIQGMPA